MAAATALGLAVEEEAGSLEVEEVVRNSLVEQAAHKLGAQAERSFAEVRASATARSFAAVRASVAERS